MINTLFYEKKFFNNITFVIQDNRYNINQVSKD